VTVKKRKKQKKEDPALGVVLGALIEAEAADIISSLNWNRAEVEKMCADERRRATDGTDFWEDRRRWRIWDGA
jgi:uncharacterized protein (DUF608 family)